MLACNTEIPVLAREMINHQAILAIKTKFSVYHHWEIKMQENLLASRPLLLQELFRNDLFLELYCAI